MRRASHRSTVTPPATSETRTLEPRQLHRHGVHVKNVVAPPPDQHAQEHVKSNEWSGSSYANFPMAVTRVFLKGHPKHFVRKPSCRGNFSTTVAPSCSA